MKKEKKSRKKEIIAAASELFQEKGYTATSMSDIAAKVGLLKGSLYAHFPSKEDILLKVIEEPMNKVTEGLIQVRDSDLPWPEKVRRGIFAQFDSRYISYYTAIFITLSELYTKARHDRNEFMFDSFRRHKEIWTDILQEGVDQGYTDGSMSAKTAYFALVGMINWTYKWYSEGGTLTIEELSEQFARLFLGGFTADRPIGSLTLQGGRVKSSESSPEQL
jgi:AcrR family transcriptional regulator